MEDRRAGTPPGRPRPPPGPTPSGRPNTGAPAIRRPTRADAASARGYGPEPPPRRQAPAVDPAGRQHWRSLDLGWIVALVGHAHERIGQAQGADDRRRQQHSLVARHRSARAVDQRTRCTGVPALGQRAICKRLVRRGRTASPYGSGSRVARPRRRPWLAQWSSALEGNPAAHSPHRIRALAGAGPDRSQYSVGSQRKVQALSTGSRSPRRPA
jgi:hypothetical protein